MSDKVNIVFTRVDNRLVHGQVGMVWTNVSGANLILVVDDKVANDKLQQSLMKMTVGATDTAIRFWSVEKTIKDIWKASTNQKIFIVTRTPREVRLLVEGGVPIDYVNLGNMHASEGKEKLYSDYIYVDEQDKADLEYLKNKNIDIVAQVLPDKKAFKL